MNYLVLHIDMEFIIGTISADNSASTIIANNRDELLWLYFFNNPHQNTITFGKENKAHFSNSEVNYYGNFFEEIEREKATFTLRGIEHPVIDLLNESGLLNILRNAYQQRIHGKSDSIPTLLTFSLTVKDNAKQKIVDYLIKQGFRIESYTIPLAELTTYHALMRNELKISSGSVAIFVEATNSTLHLMKLTLSDNYFLLDGKQKSYPGKGLDPRKQALLRFVVREISRTTYSLSEDEVIEEFKRFDTLADEWLKCLDSTTRNMPFCIRAVSLSKMLGSKRDIMVRKIDLESDTGHYTQELKDIFDDFRDENFSGSLAAVFLLGNCFLSERVKISFEQMIGSEKLFIYSNRDIQNILIMYPKIDIKRYASEEARIIERAKAEELKLAEQRAYDELQRKNREEEQKRLNAEKIAEANREEAKKLYERALEMEKKDKLEDARLNIESAITLDDANREYKLFFDNIKDKIKKLNEKFLLYKKYISNAENHLKSGDLDKALDEYEAAKFVIDNAEIIAKIIEVRGLIKNNETQKKKIAQFVSEASTLVQNKNFDTAKVKIDAILAVDSSNKEAKNLLTKIDETLQEIEIQYKALIKEADVNLCELRFESAIKKYNEALRIRPNDDYCLGQLKVVADKKESLKPPPPPPPINKPKTDIKGMIPPPPIPEKDKPLSNGLPYNKGGPPPPPSIAPNPGNNGKRPPPPPPVPKKK